VSQEENVAVCGAVVNNSVDSVIVCCYCTLFAVLL